MKLCHSMQTATWKITAGRSRQSSLQLSRLSRPAGVEDSWNYNPRARWERGPFLSVSSSCRSWKLPSAWQAVQLGRCLGANYGILDKRASGVYVGSWWACLFALWWSLRMCIWIILFKSLCMCMSTAQQHVQTLWHVRSLGCHFCFRSDYKLQYYKIVFLLNIWFLGENQKRDRKSVV